MPAAGCSAARHPQQVKRSGGCCGQLFRLHHRRRHLQQFQRRGQCRRSGQARSAARPAEPQVFLRHRQCLIKADLLTDHTVFKTIGQFRAKRDHGIAVSVAQRPVSPVSGKLPFRQLHHKHGLGFGQAHAASGGKDHAVHALRNMPHIRGAQQQGEQVIIISWGDGLPCGQQVHHLVQQLGDHIPFPQGFVRVGQVPACTQAIGQLLQGLLRPRLCKK